MIAKLLTLFVPRYMRASFDMLDGARREPGDDETPASGWYESSLDLKRGLVVIESDMAWPETQPAAWPVVL